MISEYLQSWQLLLICGALSHRIDVTAWREHWPHVACYHATMQWVHEPAHPQRPVGLSARHGGAQRAQKNLIHNAGRWPLQAIHSLVNVWELVFQSLWHGWVHLARTIVRITEMSTIEPELRLELLNERVSHRDVDVDVRVGPQPACYLILVCFD